MKNILTLLILFLLTSFTAHTDRKLPNGQYLVVLDKKFRDAGLKDYGFTLENEKFTIEISNTPEILEINWLDENTFIVKGLSEPRFPNPLEQEVMKTSRMVFQLTGQDNNNYFFKLGEKDDHYPLYAGKFIKVK